MHEEHSVAHANGVWLACFVHGYTSTSLADKFCPRHWYFIMKIKELIQQIDPTNFDNWENARLQEEDSLEMAFQKFAKSKCELLPVYNNGQYLGAVKLATLSALFLKTHLIEREKRYQLTRTTFAALIKLGTLLDQIQEATLPGVRNRIIQEGNSVIDEMKEVLKG